MTLDYARALKSYSPISFADELAYSAAWLQHIGPLTSRVEKAVQGGLLSDRMAWVFVAGYQCALRHTFSELPEDSMAAFAVSEDRKGKPPLPGVKSRQEDGVVYVSGYKTWVACCASLSHLVIKSDRGAQARYYCIERGTPGLTLTPKYGSFLAEMSQGVAKLDEVVVAKALDPSAVGHFGLRETLYIYMAFCAWAGKFGAPSELCSSIIGRLAALADHPPQDESTLAELKAVDDAVQTLRAEIPSSAATHWEQDQRLIAMYSPGIQRRELN